MSKPSAANFKAHLEKIRETIKANKSAKQANLIRQLNPVLRGWAIYHSDVVAKVKPPLGLMPMSGQCYGDEKQENQPAREVQGPMECLDMP